MTPEPIRLPRAHRGPTDPVRPNFIIAGALRSGTTSLTLWLMQHPQVFMPARKELHYFEHTHQHKVRRWEDYLAFFEPGRGKPAVGEATPSYLTKPESAAWIRFVLPDVKIILILRNPADRAFSNYCFGRARGWEDAPTFEHALERDRRWHAAPHSKEEEEEHGRECYVRRGFYAPQVQRFLDEFGPRAVRIYLFEEAVAKPRETFEDLCGFLGIRRDVVPDFSPINQSRPPAFFKLQKALEWMWKRKPVFGLERFMRLPMWLNQELGRMAVRFDRETRAALLEAYRPDILRLGRMIDRDLSRWLS